ncbi:hypothetical protein PG999_011749 [Apiospora kogelbergensis]|uniref:Uncharacterized protein n=1 Tax=Apiospora kogelbergensis TaxID=1337665 RepID=A0AAW0QFE9_9PEZI
MESSESIVDETPQSELQGVDTNSLTESDHIDEWKGPQIHNVGAEGDALASHGGAGTVEMLEVVHLLQDAGIPACVVGTHPLGYYGAGRVPIVWELCVPQDQLGQAADLFKSEPLSRLYEPWPVNSPIPMDLLHIFPRFHLKGVHFLFFLVPTSDWLLDCDEAKCEKSPMGLPYPKLEYLAQSLLDTQRLGDLEDLVDGMNLSEEWGEEHLDLNRTCDVAYARWKNEQIRASIPETPFSEMMEMDAYPKPLRPIWQKIVLPDRPGRSKAARTDNVLVFYLLKYEEHDHL